MSVLGSLLKTRKSYDHLLRSQRMLRVAKKLKKKWSEVFVFFFSLLGEKRGKNSLALLLKKWKLWTLLCVGGTENKNSSFDKKKIAMP